MMARYILDCFSRQKMIIFSWGFHQATATSNGLRFKVNGFIFKGVVEVAYNEGLDLFEIMLVKNGITIKHISNVYIDEMIDILDRNIEKDENDEKYTERVNQEYPLL